MYLNDNETATDLLYYEAISKTVVRMIQKTGDAPISIGVHGDWGAGKSSVLAMVEEAFAEDGNVVCVRFNGWQFQGFEDAKTVLIERILNVLDQSKPVLARGRGKVKGLMKRVRWFKLARKAGGLLLGATTGLPISSVGEFVIDKIRSQFSTSEGVEEASQEVESLLKEAEEKTIPAEMEAFKREFEELLKDAGIIRLVVLIDDLDRCLPSTAVETLEAIKLFLFVPRATFVIAADEAMIEYAVKQHFPDLPIGAGSLTYTRNYLEKLIQVPFRIPAMGLVETRVYVALLALESAVGSGAESFKTLRTSAREILRRPWAGELFGRAQLMKDFGGKIPAEVEESLTLSSQVSEQLTDGTKGNPRQIKRFLNAMHLRRAIAEARGLDRDIAIPILAKLLLAERFHQAFFDQICQSAASNQDGIVETLQLLEEQIYPKKKEAGKKESKPAIQELLVNENIMRWARLEPLLGAEDLRPYVLITRDKRSSFSIGGTGKFDALLERLLGGRGSVAGTRQELISLSREDSYVVFDELSARIKQKDEFLTIPQGAVGIGELVKRQSHLQEALLSLADALPASRLGSWIIGDAGWGASFVDTPSKGKWATLLNKWQQDGVTPELQKTARAMSSVGNEKV